MSPSTGAVIREIRVDDASVVARLTGELGYPAAPEEVAARIRALLPAGDRVIYVACLAGEGVVGWIDVHITHHLQAAPRAEIGGLVVSSAARGQGIGRQLVAQAERWALERGIKQVVVRSQIARERAHRFYLREGYQRTKTSAVFSKDL
ncbi:MAG: GNAT family N-acetyltransferase [Acidobacteriia bacterium]|nr:GNAT family N-acetyltransferase [Terriglobia bacterium]